jgi:hypothetical protein
MKTSQVATPIETVMTTTGVAEAVLDRLDRSTHDRMIWERLRVAFNLRSCARNR